MTDTSLHVTCVGTCVACGRIVDVYVRWDGSERVEAHDGCSGAGSSPRGRLPLPR